MYHKTKGTALALALHHSCKGGTLGGAGRVTLLQQHHGVQSRIRQAMYGYQLDVTSLLPLMGLHITSAHHPGFQER